MDNPVGAILVTIVVLALLSLLFLPIIAAVVDLHEWRYSDPMQDSNDRFFQVKRCQDCGKSKIKYISSIPINRKK